MLDARRIKVLCEVARTGSFSAAAAELGYTQPAVSRQIATLEAEVGMMLVRRVHHGIALTDAGRVLVERGQRILAGLVEAELELKALAGLAGGTLRMASFPSAAATIVPLAVVAFRQRHPAVELSVELADPAVSFPRLREGTLDLALSPDPESRGDLCPTPSRHRPGSGASGLPAGSPVPRGRVRANSQPSLADRAVLSGPLESVHLFDDPMYVAVPADHPLAGARRLSLAQFAAEPWMLATSDTCPDSRLFLRACHDAGFEPQIVFQNDDYPAILGFVAAGVGVAMIPDMASRGVREGVVVRTVDPPPPPRPISVLAPAGYRSPAAAAMIDVLLAISRRWVDDRPPLEGRHLARPAAADRRPPGSGEPGDDEPVADAPASAAA